MPSSVAAGTRRPHLLLVILAVALAVRLAHWWAVREAPFVALLAVDAQEYDRWAQRIAAGDWLGEETFFQAPLYPYLLGGLYRLVGRSLDAVYLFQILLAAAGCWALYRAGRAMAGEAVGLGAAGLAALYGPFVFYDVQVGKESLAVSAVCFLLWMLAAARLPRPSDSPAGSSPLRQAARGDGGRLALWLAAGALLGVVALLRENALLVLPFLLPLAWRREDRIAGFVRRGGTLLLGLAAILAPIAIRNAIVGGSPLPTTSQGGVNLYIGNNPAADGAYRPLVPGRQEPALERRAPELLAERALGRVLTPAEVSGYWARRALVWAAAEPAAALRLQFRKLAMFWSWYEWPDAVDYYYLRRLSPPLRLAFVELGGVTLLAAAGLWWVRRRPAAMAPALLWIAGWTAATVVFFLFSRYRLPVVPALLLLAAHPLAAAAEHWRAHRRGAAAALATLCLAALVAPHAAGHAPRLDLVHYNLARLEEQRGRLDAAAAHDRAALALDPEAFLPHLTLGRHAARRGHWSEALRLFTRAAQLEPRSPEAWSNLGGVYLATGDPRRARRCLEQALALDPESLPALHNLALLALREGDLPRARALNRRALAIAPDHPAARRLAAHLAATVDIRGHRE